jgi:hemolysin activation/secretion protein
MRFRLGGMHTVRGFDYGVLTGAAFWAAQLDVSPLRGTIRPVLFVDAGQAAPAADLFGSRALAGGGVGVSVYSPLLRTTLIRLDLSHPISPDTGGTWRFDLVFSPVR